MHDDASNGPAVENPAISVQQLRHAFKNRLALNDVNFEVENGSIHGFVGPNGAGKTTTLKVLATLLKPQRGRITVVGHDVQRSWKHVRRKIGYMPDHFSMYRNMTVFEYLDFFGAAYGLTFERRDRIIQDVLTLTDMTGRRNDLIKSLSRGMMQRVSLARVLVNDPQLLLLDEPASGLDPRARIELMEILRELRRMGKTIFISSHILSELADLCDAVTIIDHGEIRYSGTMDELLKQEGEHVSWVLVLSEPQPDIESALRALPSVEDLEVEAEGNAYRITMTRSDDASACILRQVLAGGGRVVSFQEDRRHLNQVFMDLTEPGVR